MNRFRIKLAAGLLASVISALGGAQAHAATSAMRYACEGRQNLVVERTGATARVRLIDRVYELRRKPSSIGVKYLGSGAALIIDGPSAVFVAEDRLQFGNCVEEIPVASVANPWI